MTTKAIVFEGPQAAARFARLYEAVIVGGMMPAQKRGIEVYRREADILNALDTISEIDPSAKPLAPHAPGRVLVPVGGSITLTMGDITLLLDRLKLEDVWQAAVSRQIVDTVDWLTAIRDRADA